MRADTISTPSVSPALTVQGRVIAALILREIHTLYGNTRLGYLWAIIQTAFGIGVILGLSVKLWGRMRLMVWGWPYFCSAVLFPGIYSAIPSPGA